MGGEPKGLQRLGRLRLLDHVFGTLGQVARTVVIAANDPGAAEWIPGIAVLPDLHPGSGGLAGVEAALATGRDVIVVAWDMPFVSASLLQSLLDAAEANGADAVLPASDSPHGVEPFCAFYSQRVLGLLSEFLGAEAGPAHMFARSLPRLRVLTRDEVALSGDPARLFFSVNSREDLERARALWGR